MKLKEAKRIAKMLGYNWLAVDASGVIFMYKDKPHIDFYEDEAWNSDNTSFLDGYYQGEYTGSKHWTQTRRKL